MGDPRREPQTERLLLVEGDRRICEALADILQDRGYAVACAADGQEALQHLHGGPLPSLILLDMLLPPTSRGEFLRQQRQDPATAAIPVVGVAASDAEHEAGALGVDDFFEIPMDLPAMLDTIDRRCRPPERIQN